MALAYEIKVPFEYKRYNKNIDPLKITNVQDYFLNQHLHLQLIDGMSFNELKYISIESLQWNKLDLHIKLKSDLRDSKGESIGAKDLYYSLLRHIKIEDATHGSLSKILAHCDNIDDCLILGDTEVILKCKSKQDIVKQFMQIDFAIIPFKSLDKDLNIIDLKRTAGPYYLEGKSELKLIKNKFYKFPLKNSADKIKLIQIDSANGLNGNFDKYDLIPAIHTYQAKNLPKGYKLFESDDLSLNQITFTKNGLQNIDISERLYFEKLIIALLDQSKVKRVKQIYKEDSSYSLNEDEVAKINIGKIEKLKKPVKKLILGTSNNRLPFWKSVLNHPEIELKVVNSQDDMEKYHGILYTMDVSYEATISFINYVMKSGAWGLYDEEMNTLLSQFQSKTTKEDRLSIVKNITKKIYSEVRIIPLFRDTYKTVYKDGFKVHFEKKSPNLALWLITKEDE